MAGNDASAPTSEKGASPPPAPKSGLSTPQSGQSEGSKGVQCHDTWWQKAMAAQKQETREQPWTHTVERDEMDYSRPNHYTVPSGIMSYDETTN